MCLRVSERATLRYNFADTQSVRNTDIAAATNTYISVYTHVCTQEISFEFSFIRDYAVCAEELFKATKK